MFCKFWSLKETLLHQVSLRTIHHLSCSAPCLPSSCAPHTSPSHTQHHNSETFLQNVEYSSVGAINVAITGLCVVKVDPSVPQECGGGAGPAGGPLHCLLECNTFDIDVNSFHNTRVLGHIKIFAKQTASQWLTVWTSKCPDFMFITFKCKESKTLLKCGKVVVGALNMEKAPVTSRGWGPSPNIVKMMYYAHWCHNCGALVAGPLALGGVGTMRQCGAAHQLSGASWRGHIALVSRAHVTRDGGGARDAGHVTQHVLCAVRHLLDRIPCDHHQCAAVPRLAAENARWKLSVSWTRHGQPAAVSSSSRYSVISQPSE